MKKVTMAVTLAAMSFSSFASTYHFPIGDSGKTEIVMSEDLKQLVILKENGKAAHYHQFRSRNHLLNNYGQDYSLIEFLSNVNRHYYFSMQIFPKGDRVCLSQYKDDITVFDMCIDNSKVWQD